MTMNSAAATASVMAMKIRNCRTRYRSMSRVVSRAAVANRRSRVRSGRGTFCQSTSSRCHITPMRGARHSKPVTSSNAPPITPNTTLGVHTPTAGGEGPRVGTPLQRGQHQVVGHEDAEAAHERDAAAAALRADGERKADEGEDQGGQGHGDALVPLDPERRPAVPVAAQLGDLLRQRAEPQVLLRLLEAR